MIDRSYLPFQSAREYRDRGMMKWMGFFLSEHTTSLDNDKHKVDMSSGLSQVDKLILIGQLYASQLKGTFTVRGEKEKLTYSGNVSELSPKEITIKTDDSYQLIQVESILSIQMAEELDYE